MKNIMLAMLLGVLVTGVTSAEVYNGNISVKDSLEAKFKADLPSGWTAKLSSDKKLNINGEKKDGKAVNKATIKVGFDAVKSQKDVPADYIEKIKKYYISMMDPKLAKEGVKQGEGSVGKLKGIKLEYKLNIATATYKFWQFISKIDNDNIVIITCTAPEAHFSAFEEEYKTIVGSMEIELAK